MKKRFFSFSFLITSISIILFSILFSDINYQNSITSKKNELDIYASMYDKNLYAPNDEGASLFSSQLKGVHVVFIDFNGIVLGDSKEASNIEDYNELDDVKIALENKVGYIVENSKIISKNILHYCVKKDDLLIRFSVFIDSSLAIYKQALPITLLFLLIDIIFCAIIAYLAIDSILKPVEELIRESVLQQTPNVQYPELQPLASLLSENNEETQKKIEKIKQNKRIEKLVLNNMEHGIIILNEDFKIILINQAASILLKVLRDEDEVTYLSRDEEIFASMKRKENATFYRNLEQNNYAIRLTYTEHSYVLLLTDITEMKKAEQSKNDFIANVTHEMNTPLTSIKGFAELISSHSLTDKQVDHACEVIIKQTNRLSLLIKNIINYASLENDTVETYEVNVSSVVKSVLSTLESTTKTKNITVKSNIEDNLVLYSKNESILEIAMNLISNAIKYNKQDGEVYVSLVKKDEAICLEVQDTGIGIDKKNHVRIFDRFFTVDGSHNEHTSGFGLGLAIVKKICLQEGFKIEVDSELNKGSTFKVFMYSTKNK